MGLGMTLANESRKLFKMFYLASVLLELGVGIEQVLLIYLLCRQCNDGEK